MSSNEHTGKETKIEVIPEGSTSLVPYLYMYLFLYKWIDNKYVEYMKKSEYAFKYKKRTFVVKVIVFIFHQFLSELIRLFFRN